MKSATFSPIAVAEVERAVQWLRERDLGAAERLGEAVFDAAATLGRRPLLGRVQLRFAPARYRFWRLPGFPYLLVYDPALDPPLILRLLHTAQDLPNHLRPLRP